MYLSRFLDFFGWPQRPQNNPKMTPKIVKTENFQFCAIFVKLSINFLALNVENNPKRKKLLSKRLFQKNKCNASNSDPNWQKYSKIQNFENFMQFLSTSRKTWWLRMSKTLNKGKIRCPGDFLEEIKAICVEKMHQIWTEIDKILENSDFWNFYAIFVYFSKDLVA